MMSVSRFLFYSSLSFVVGVGINSFLNITPLLLVGVFIWLALLLISVFQKKKFVLIGVCLLVVAFGVWYHHQALVQVKSNNLQELYGKEIQMSGTVVKEPDVRSDQVKLAVKPEEIKNFDKQVKGQILISTNRHYNYKDKLKVKGELKKPAVFDDFNYKKYLEKEHIYGVMYQAQVELTEERNTAYGSLLKLKNKLRQVIYSNFSPPHSEVLGAMLLGDKQKLSDSLKEDLNKAGLRHVTAVSGMHVAIIMSAAVALLVGLGLSKSNAFWGALLFIFAFTALTGFQVSTIRAAFLSGIFLLGQQVGRKKNSYRALVFIAVAMLLFNPLLLKRSVSFQLSFTAVFGIMSLSPIIKDYLTKVPDWLGLRNILAMTFSAQLFVLPILIYHFGRFSLVTPLSNILVIPLLPYLMGLGFVFLIGGLIWSKLGWLLALPLWLLVAFVVRVSQFLAGFSFLYQSISVSWFYILIYYLLLALVIWRVKKKRKTKLSFLLY